MASITASTHCAHLWVWTTLLLSLAPWSVRAAPPTVDVNGTSIVGMSQKFADIIDVEFFGGQYLCTHSGFVVHKNQITDASRLGANAGIPFAEPPLGDLRFAAPVEIESLGVPTFNATAFGAPCVQFDVCGSCLYAGDQMLIVASPGGWRFGGLSDSEYLPPIRVGARVGGSRARDAMDIWRKLPGRGLLGLQRRRDYRTKRCEGTFSMLPRGWCPG